MWKAWHVYLDSLFKCYLSLLRQNTLMRICNDLQVRNSKFLGKSPSLKQPYSVTASLHEVDDSRTLPKGSGRGDANSSGPHQLYDDSDSLLLETSVRLQGLQSSGFSNMCPYPLNKKEDPGMNVFFVCHLDLVNIRQQSTEFLSSVTRILFYRPRGLVRSCEWARIQATV